METQFPYLFIYFLVHGVYVHVLFACDLLMFEKAQASNLMLYWHLDPNSTEK